MLFVQKFLWRLSASVYDAVIKVAYHECATANVTAVAAAAPTTSWKFLGAVCIHDRVSSRSYDPVKPLPIYRYFGLTIAVSANVAQNALARQKS